MSKEMDMNAFNKSLAALQGMAKSQLFHTPSDSDPGSWSGSVSSSEEGQEDNISDNGTDYDAVKKSLAAKVAKSQALTPAEVAIVKGQSPYKAIAAKIEKGQALTPAESWALKGGRAIFKSEEASGPSGGAARAKTDEPAGEQDDASSVPPTNAGSDAEDKEKEAQAKKGMPAFLKDDDDAEKSLRAAAARGQHLSKGIEASPFLAEFVGAFGEALKGLEARTAQRIVKSLAPLFGELAATKKSLADLTTKVNAQGEISKALAEAVVGIGQHVAGSAESNAAAGSLPAGGPRSQLRAISGGQGTGPAPIEKSLGGLDVGPSALQKSQLVEVMGEMVKSNQLNPLDVIKFESTGEMGPGVNQKVQAFIAKARG